MSCRAKDTLVYRDMLKGDQGYTSTVSRDRLVLRGVKSKNSKDGMLKECAKIGGRS